MERVNFKKYFLVCLGRGGEFVLPGGGGGGGGEGRGQVNSQAKRFVLWD